MPPLRHDALTKRSLKNRYHEYRSAKTSPASTKENETSTRASKAPTLITLSWRESCVRCKDYDLECRTLPGRACTNCQQLDEDGDEDGDDEYADIGCMRRDLSDIIASGIPDLPGLGSDEWLCPTRDGSFFKITMEYPAPEHTRIKDLDHFATNEDTTTSRTQAIITFIQQFRDIDTRWDGCYGTTTADIIDLCVDVQETILKESEKSWNLLGDRNTIIVTSLRALGLAHDIFNLDVNYTGIVEKDLRPSSFKPRTLPTDDPIITLSKLKKMPKKFEAKDVKLPILVRQMHHVTQKMLVRPQAKDMPAILCVLCLMKLVSFCLEPINKLFDTMSTKEYNTAWYSYCMLFDDLARSYHPLVRDWDKSDYEQVVGEGSVSLAHFEAFHDIWVGDGFENPCSDMPFPKRLDDFTMGDIWY